MDVVEKYFLSPTDDWEIHYYCAFPQEKIKASVEISHGMYENVDAYQSLMEFLCNNGYAVYFLEHRGHGDSASHGLGNLGESDIYLKMIRDIRALNVIIRKQFPYSKIYLLGNSLSAFLVQRYIQIYPNTISGMIQCAAGGKDQVPHIKLGKNIAYSLKKMGFSQKKSPLLFEHQQSFLDSMENSKWLLFSVKNAISKEKLLSIFSKKDEKAYTVNAYYWIYRGICENFNRKAMKPVNKELPILLLSGNRDPIGSFGEGILHLVRWYQSFGMNSVQCKLYEGIGHNILRSSKREEIYQDIVDWLETVY